MKKGKVSACMVFDRKHAESYGNSADKIKPRGPLHDKYVYFMTINQYIIYCFIYSFD